jgi:hypothetical protein
MSYLENLPCPACGYLTLDNATYGSYDICGVCGWEDDGVQLGNPACGGGANSESLVEAQAGALRRFPLSIQEHNGIPRSIAWRPLNEEERERADRERAEKYWKNPAVWSLAGCYWTMGGVG